MMLEISRTTPRPFALLAKYTSPHCLSMSNKVKAVKPESELSPWCANAFPVESLSIAQPSPQLTPGATSTAGVCINRQVSGRKPAPCSIATKKRA